MLDSSPDSSRSLTLEARDRARTATILSISTEVPSGRLTNAELAERLGLTEEWIFSRTGVRERPMALPEDRLSDFAARAGAGALERARVDAAELDLIIVSTLSQDELTPNTAPLVAEQLGAVRAGAIDVGAACTAFLSGLALGTAQIESGRADRVLLIGADFITRLVDYEDKRTASLFADGAGAVVLGLSDGENGAVGPIALRSDGSMAQSIQISHSDRKIRMDGPEVFRHAVARMTEITHTVVGQAGLTLDDIDLFVYHQANGRITKALGEKLGVSTERVVDCIEMLGNSSAATLPLGLAHAERAGRLRPGMRVALGAFGAGFTWGGGVVEWGLRDG